MENKERESFGSRLGFILVSAGCAIGIGNVWKFPYICGQNGGAIFVIFYLLFLLIMGIPLLTMELAMGRSSRNTIVGAFKLLEKEGSKWHIQGWLCIAGNYILMMYYTTVSAWMLDYFFKFMMGSFSKEGVSVQGVYDNMLSNPKEMTGFMVIIVLVGFLVLSFGVQKGLERINKFMMLGLLSLIAVLAVRSVTLPGSGEGISFYLMPNMENVRHVGIFNVISAAMEQAFFTLSIGLASMEIFGSYMSKEHSLTGEAIRICALDTFVAILSGLIIFPACFSFGIHPDAGPPLIFITLPGIFINLPAGRLWGTLFFLFMTFASFSTVTAVFENLVASMIDNFNISRNKAVVINEIIILIGSMPCVLGFNVLSGLTLIKGMGVLDSEDFIVSNLLLPAGCLVILLFCINKNGWGADNYLEETNTGKGIKMSRKLIGYYKYILPVLIAIILLNGLI